MRWKEHVAEDKEMEHTTCILVWKPEIRGYARILNYKWELNISFNKRDEICATEK
jgi:hypothetical protein